MALVQLSAADADAPTELSRGDTVELRLPESPDAGFRWRWRLPVTLRMVADEQIDGMVRRLAFDVTAPGRHELRAELALPWEGDARQALTFVLYAV